MKVNASGYEDSDRSSWKRTRITTNATTVIKAAPGLLHAIVVNTKGAAANVATVYDSPSTNANPIAQIDTVGAVIGTIIYDAEMLNGITIITATGTPADITVLWA